MPSARSVQFRGIDQVIKAYENMDIPRWGLFQTSQFLAKYDGNSVAEGSELLEQILVAFDPRSADTTTYTLCVYDGLADGEKIKSNTRYDGSFNFRLFDTIDNHNQQKQIGSTGLENRIAGIEEQLKLLNAEPEIETEPEVNPAMAMVYKLLEHPEIQKRIAGVAMNLFDSVSEKISGIFQIKNPVAKVAGVNDVLNQNDVEQENLKLQQAVNILAEIDPQLGTHLLKLAEVAKNDPAKYNSMIAMLNLL